MSRRFQILSHGSVDACVKLPNARENQSRSRIGQKWVLAVRDKVGQRGSNRTNGPIVLNFLDLNPKLTLEQASIGHN